MSNQTVLVTGASGFIGTAVTKAFLSADFCVRAMSRQGTSSLPSHPNLTIVQGDMTDVASLGKALEGVDFVVHLAAAKSDEANSVEVNVGGAQNLVNAMKEHGAKFLINISTQSAKLKKKGAYGKTKAQADEIFHASGIPVTTLRCSLVYGDVQDGVFGTIVKYSSLPMIPVFGNGENRFSPIHRDDLAQIIVAAAQHTAMRGHSYDVGGVDSLSFNELIKAILDERGMQRPILHIPVWIGLIAARILSVLPKPPITMSNVLGGAENVPMDIQPILRDSGVKPRSFAEGLARAFPKQIV